MKRLITYLYDYESGTKGKGTGFIRADQRGREIRMEVHVRDAKHMQEKGKLYLIAGKNPVLGIYVGDITMIRGDGDESFRFSGSNMCDSGMDFSDVIGVAIQSKEGYLASNWQEESCSELLKGNFRIIERETKVKAQTILPENVDIQVQITNSDIGQAEEHIPVVEMLPVIEQVQVEKISDEPVYEESIKSDSSVSEDISSEEDLSVDMNQPIIEKPTYRKIQISHIRNLPPQNRHLANNNFLRHGFFNYNYLILKKEKTPSGELWSLGVPGVYEQPERMMANMFGFPHFEAQEEENDDKLKEGTAGAWFTPLQM